MKEPGDIGTAFHLKQSRVGPSGRLESSQPPTQSSLLYKPAHWPLSTHKIHTVLSQPVETLEEEEESEECNKSRAEVIPKNGEGQTSLSNSIPGTLQKVLGVGQGMMWNPDILLAPHPALRFRANNILPPSPLPSAAQRTPCPLPCPRGRQGRRPGCTGPRSGESLWFGVTFCCPLPGAHHSGTSPSLYQFI